MEAGLRLTARNGVCYPCGEAAGSGEADRMTAAQTTPTSGPGRIDAIDVARGCALVAMAIYHFTWDLEFFGHVPLGMTGIGGWKLFARCIASSFLFLAGVSLFLAHGRGIRWQGFWRRFAMVAGAALAISAATYFFVPDAFIFFGILHQIALASLLGLAFLRLPAWAVLVAALAVIAAPHYLRSALFDHPWWWWLGLSEATPRSNDFVPLFPWFGVVLIGVATAKLAKASGLLARLAQVRIGGAARPLALAGRHSLAFYLIHQPVLIACVWAYSQVFPATPRFPVLACEVSCKDTRDSAFCARYCDCLKVTLEGENALEGESMSNPGPELRTRLAEVAGMCTAEIDAGVPEAGGAQ